MKIKVSEAIGPVLDWMVAKAQKLPVELRLSCLVNGPRFVIFTNQRWVGDQERWDRYEPSDSWSQGGPIIDANPAMQFWPWGGTPDERNGELQCASLPSPIDGHTRYRTWFGSSKLIAAMRCFVAFNLGDAVDVPEELL